MAAHKDIDDLRAVAKVICETTTGVCVQVHDPERQECTEHNCRMMLIARQALRKAAIK